MDEKENFIIGPVRVRRVKAYGAISICFWLVLWQIVSMKINNEIILVSPVQVAHYLGSMIQDQKFYVILISSFVRIMSGLAAGVLLGAVMAMLSCFIPAIAYILKPVVTVVKATPVASFVILVLVWAGSSSLTFFCVLLMVFPIVYTNVYQGLCQTDPKLLEMSQVFSITFPRKLRYIYLPGCIPYMLAALNMSVGLCFKAGTAAEVIGIPKNSIGEQLYMGKLYLNMQEILSWTVVIVVISLLAEKVVAKLFLLLSVKLGGERQGNKND